MAQRMRGSQGDNSQMSVREFCQPIDSSRSLTSGASAPCRHCQHLTAGKHDPRRCRPGKYRPPIPCFAALDVVVALEAPSPRREQLTLMSPTAEAATRSHEKLAVSDKALRGGEIVIVDPHPQIPVEPASSAQAIVFVLRTSE